GEVWNYSVSVEIQAALVEKFSGEPIDIYLEKHIFKPLGMNNTTFFVDERNRSRLAQRYKYDETTHQLRPVPLGQDSIALSRDQKFLAGAGGLVSTMGDYLRFCAMLDNGGMLNGKRVLKEKTVKLMMQDHIPLSTESKPGGISGYGFGLDGAVL